MLLLLLAAAAAASRALGATSTWRCADHEFTNEDQKYVAVHWCQNGGVCMITLDDDTMAYEVACDCPSTHTLPDCSFRLPSQTDTERDATNTCNNTCLIEDILQLNQWKNDEIYGRYVQ